MPPRKKKEQQVLKPKKKYKLVVDECQAAVLKEALDLFSRITMGQLECVAENFRFRLDKRLENRWEMLDLSRSLLDVIKKMLFQQPPNGSHGIYHPEVPEDARVAWDLVKVIRHELWKNREIREGEEDYRMGGVDSYPADQSAKNQPLAQCELIPEEMQ